MVSLRNLACIAFLVVATFFFFDNMGEGGQFNWERSVPGGQWLVVAGLMTLGIVFGCLYRQISGRRGRVDIALEVREMWGSGSFWCALLAAPVVFGGVVVGFTNENPGSSIALWFAFHNGFFCETVMDMTLRGGSRNVDS